MANFRTLPSATGLLVALTLAGCGSMNTPYNTGASGPTYYPPATTSGAPYAQYGVVQSIELVRQDNSGIGAGTIVGAVIGGIVGNQVGGGRGNTAATVIGAAGGAYAGHEIEKRNQQPSEAYKLTIRMRDGSIQTLMQTATGDIQVGDRVVVENGAARRY